MVHRLRSIIAHDEWVGLQRLRAVWTGVVQTHHSRQQAVGVVDNEHLVVLLHQSLSESMILPGPRLSGRSVGNGRTDGKRVGQFEYPNGVKSLMRRSLPSKSQKSRFSEQMTHVASTGSLGW